MIFLPIMKLKVKIISETSVRDYQTTRRYGPADRRLRIYGRENSSFHSFRSCVNERRTVLGIRTYADNAVYPDICGQSVLSIRKLTDSFFLYIQTYNVISLCIQKLWIMCPVCPDIWKFVLCIRTDAGNVFSLSGYLRTCFLFPDIRTFYPDNCGQCALLYRTYTVCPVSGQLRIQINMTNHVLNISAKFLSWVCLCFNVSCYELSTLTWFSIWCVYKLQTFCDVALSVYLIIYKYLKCYLQPSVMSSFLPAFY